MSIILFLNKTSKNLIPFNEGGDNVYEYESKLEINQPKMSPFYWILTMEVYTILFIISIGIVIGPLYFAMKHHLLWYGVSLIGAIIAIFLIKFLYRSTKKLIWLNTHLSNYQLSSSGIKFKRYEELYKHPIEGKIPLASIEKIYFGFYLFENYHAYAESKINEAVPMYANLPGLLFQYQDSNQSKLFFVPFNHMLSIDGWLKFLRSHHSLIELKFIDLDLSMISSVEELERNQDSIYNMEYNRDIWGAFDEVITRIEDTIEENDEIDSTITEELVEEAKENPKGYSLKRSTFITVILLILSMYVYRFLIDHGWQNERNAWIPLIVSSLIGFIYFFLMAKPRWYYSILFYVLFFSFNLVLGIFWEEDGKVSSIFTDTLAAVLIILVPFTFIPFFISKMIQKRRKKKVEREKLI